MICEQLVALMNMAKAIIKVRVNVQLAEMLVVKRHRVFMLVHKMKRIYISKKMQNGGTLTACLTRRIRSSYNLTAGIFHEVICNRARRIFQKSIKCQLENEMHASIFLNKVQAFKAMMNKIQTELRFRISQVNYKRQFLEHLWDRLINSVS